MSEQLDASHLASRDTFVEYLSTEIRRAIDAYTGRAAGPERVLAIGQALALFNLADRFHLSGEVRQRLHLLAGTDLYTVFSNAMRDVYGIRGDR